MARPSPSIVPSALSANGLQSPDGDSAVTLAKHMNIRMSLSASTPPVMTISESPRYSSLSAI
ncbi:hypothetical protein MYIN104542_12075 [Mycobacterium intermedium]